MTKRMLISLKWGQLRVALVDDQLLYNLDIERIGHAQKKANIYKGRITRVEPSLEAAFVDYGADRHGFLPLKEIARDYFKDGHPADIGRANIRELVKSGQEVLVQIDKEERGSKGAALTTFVALAGCYLVLMPNNPRAGGISRRIEGDEREELREAIADLPVPEGMGVIVRTAGLGRSQEELEWDLKVLLNQWNAIQTAANNVNAPALIYQESDAIMRAIRDYLRPDISEILVDNPAAFERARDHIRLMRPDFAQKIKPYEDSVPLFSRYQIEHQIETAFQREVALPNGASIVIDPTEALVAIDINSAKATSGVDIEETAFQSNLAAASEIARQLRLRDMGGLIVIDFIDMSNPKHQRAVEQALKEELKHDRARIQVGRISRFGLLEMSRQRLKSSLGEQSLVTCPQCEGQGTIRGVQSLALAIVRVIEEEAMKTHTAEIHVQLPVDVATYLLNEKRDALMTLERRHAVRILLIPNTHLLVPHYHIDRIRHSDDIDTSKPSYEMASTPDSAQHDRVLPAFINDTPAVSRPVVSSDPAPASKGSSLIKRLWTAVFGSSSEQPLPVAAQPVPETLKQHRATMNRERKSGGTGHMRSRSNNRSSPDRRRREPKETPEIKEEMPAVTLPESRQPRAPKPARRTTSRPPRAARPEVSHDTAAHLPPEERPDNWGNIVTPVPDELAPVSLTMHELGGIETPPNRVNDEAPAPRTRTGGTRHPYGSRSRGGRRNGPRRESSERQPAMMEPSYEPAPPPFVAEEAPVALPSPPKKAKRLPLKPLADIPLPPPTAFESAEPLAQVRSQKTTAVSLPPPPTPKAKPAPKVFDIGPELVEAGPVLHQVRSKSSS